MNLVLNNRIIYCKALRNLQENAHPRELAKKGKKHLQGCWILAHANEFQKGNSALEHNIEDFHIYTCVYDGATFAYSRLGVCVWFNFLS